MSARVCAVCATPDPQSFFRLDGVPVHQNVLLPSRREALACDTATLDLVFCPVCGFIGNAAFDPARLHYSPRYENTQTCSPSFRAYLEEIADRLIRRHELRGRRVIEIGCGKGDFLSLLCRSGDVDAVGFDPSFEPDRAPLPRSVRIVRDFYSERYADYRADLVCCRHTLEHVADPAAFLRVLRRALGERAAAVFFEVPDARFILESLAFWDLCYEHCNYFSPPSLAYLFEASGFGSVEVTTAFGDQYLWLDAHTASTPARPEPRRADVKTLGEVVARFGAALLRRMDDARAAIEAARQEGRRVVIWGAGAKGVMFLNGLGIGREVIEYVIDINPRKQGGFIAGSGQEIAPPEFLREYKPDTVFVMNPNYVAEVQAELARLGLDPLVLTP